MRATPKLVAAVLGLTTAVLGGCARDQVIAEQHGSAVAHNKQAHIINPTPTEVQDQTLVGERAVRAVRRYHAGENGQEIAPKGMISTRGGAEQ